MKPIDICVTNGGNIHDELEEIWKKIKDEDCVVLYFKKRNLVFENMFVKYKDKYRCIYYSESVGSWCITPQVNIESNLAVILKNKPDYVDKKLMEEFKDYLLVEAI